MSKPLIKVIKEVLPGKPVHSVINESGVLVVESRADKTWLTRFDLTRGKKDQQSSEVLGHWHELIGLEGDALIFREYTHHRNPELVSFHRYDWSKDRLRATENIEVFPEPNRPVIYPEGSESFRTIQKYLGQGISLACEYLEQQETIFISYYLKKTTRFDRYLQVILNGSIVYHEKQDEGLMGFAPNSFYTFKNHLFFIRNDNELNVYEV